MLLFLMMMVSVEAYQYHKELFGQYVLELTADCPSAPSGSLPVRVLSDLNLRIRAYCKDNYTTVIYSPDEVNFAFDPLFRGNSREKCVLNKERNSNTYILHLDLEYGEPQSLIRPIVEPYVITCAYDPHSTRTSNKQGIGRGLIAPTEIQANEGKHGSSNLRLRVVNIMGKSTPKKLKRGQLVRLAGTSDGAGGEKGLRATACDAVGNNGVHYAVLRAGCGDGIVFKRTEGFTTEGLNVYSPFFHVFNLKNSVFLRFECNYTLCTKNCDGSSCVDQAARSQRSPDDVYASGHLIAVSRALEMQDEGKVDQREPGDVDLEDEDDDDDEVHEGMVHENVHSEDVTSDNMDVNYHSLRNTGLSHNTASANPWWQTPVVILTMAILLTLLMGGSALLMHRRRMTSVSLA